MAKYMVRLLPALFSLSPCYTVHLYEKMSSSFITDSFLLICETMDSFVQTKVQPMDCIGYFLDRGNGRYVNMLS